MKTKIPEKQRAEIVQAAQTAFATTAAEEDAFINKLGAHFDRQRAEASKLVSKRPLKDS
jgi:hypothetical protein